MIGFLLGSFSATGFLGATGYVIKTCRSQKLHDLTGSTEILMDKVSRSKEPRSQGGSIPLADIFSIYLNSRANREWVNRKRADVNNPEWDFLLDEIRQDHELIKRLAIACTADRLIDRLISNCDSSTRHKRLLWKYADEQEILTELAPFCSPRDQNFISTRV
jgi:hypothetical protein